MPSLADQDQQFFAFSTGKSPINNSINALERYYWASQIGMSDAIAESLSLADVKWRALKQLATQQGFLPAGSNPEQWSITDLEYRWLARVLGLTAEQAMSQGKSWADMWNVFTDSMVGQDIVSDAVGFWDARQGAQPSGYLPNLGTGGPALDLYAAGGTARPKLNYPLTGLNLPGTTGNYVMTPYQASHAITGDIEVVARVNISTYPTAQTNVIGRFQTGQRSWAIQFTATGLMSIIWSTDLSNSFGINSSVALPSPIGAMWLKWTFDLDNGAAGRTAKFYTAPDSPTEPTTWTQLGTDVVQATATTLAVGTSFLEIGTYNAGGTAPFNGAILETKVRNGIGGPVVANFRSSDLNPFTFRGVAPTGETWNVVYVVTTNDPVFLPFSGTSQTISPAYVSLPGTVGSYISTPDDPSLEPGSSTMILEVDCALTEWNTSTTQVLAAKYGLAGQRSYELFMGVGILCLAVSQDGSTYDYGAATSVSVPVSAGQRKQLRVTAVPGNPGTCTFEIADPGGAYTQIGVVTNLNTTSWFNSNTKFTIGAPDTTEAQCAAGKFYSVKLTIGGTVRANWVAGQTIDSTGKAWTLNGSATLVAAVTSGTSQPEKYVYTPGVISTINRITTPLSNAYSGACQTVQVDFRILDGTSFFNGSGNKGIIGCRDVAGGWGFFMSATTMYWSPKETTQASFDTPTAPLTIAQLNQLGTAKWIRVVGTLTAASRIVTIYVSDDYQNWTQVITAAQAGAASGSVGPTTIPLTISNYQYGGSSFQSEAKWLEMIVTIDGTKRVHWRAADMNQNGGVSPITGETWTIDRNATGRKSVLVERPTFLLGTDDYFECPDNDLLDFPPSVAMTHVFVYRTWPSGSGQFHWAKASSSGMAKGYAAREGSGTAEGYVPIFDNAANGTGNVFLGQPQTIILAVTDGLSGARNITQYGGQPAGTKNFPTASDLTNTEVLRVGRLSGAGTNYSDFEFLGMAIYRYFIGPDEAQQIIDFFSLPVLATPPKTTKDWIAANATLFLDPKQASQPSGYMRNLGIGGSVLDAYAAGTTTRLYLTSAGSVNLPGNANGANISTPDSNALDVVGDIDVRVKLSTPDWTPVTNYVIFSKWDHSIAQKSYELQLQPTGTLLLQWTDAGQVGRSTQSTVAVPFADGSTGWVRATLDVDNGAAGSNTVFYTSTDGITWTQLGTTVTTAFVTTIAASTAPLVIGQRYNLASNFFPGQIYELEIWNGIAGTKVANFRASDLNQSTLKGTAPTGEVWSVNWTATTNDPTYLPYSGEKYLYNGQGGENNTAIQTTSIPGGSIIHDIRAKIMYDGGGTGRLTQTADLGGTATRYEAVVDNAVQNGRYRIWSIISTSGGTSAASYSPYIVAPRQNMWVRIVFDASAGTIRYYHNDTDSTDEPTTWTDDGLGNAAALPAGTFFSIGKIGVSGNCLTGAGYRGPFSGSIYRVNFYMDGSLLTSFNPNALSQTGGGGWVLNRSATGRKAVLVERPCWLFGTDDWLEIPDNDLLDLKAADSFSVIVSLRMWDWTTNAVFIDKKQANTVIAGWNLWSGSGNLTRAAIADGTLALSRNPPANVPGELNAQGMTIGPQTTGIITPYKNGVMGQTPLARTPGDCSNALAMRIGRFAGSGTGYADMEFAGVAIFRRELTQAEVQSVCSYFTGS